MQLVLTVFRQQRTAAQWVGLLFPVLLFAAGIFYLHDYLKDSIVTLLAGGAAVVATSRKEKVRSQHRFAIAALCMLALTWVVPVKTLLYFLTGFILFYWIERQSIRVHFLGVVALFLASPAFQYASSVFSFPIRLQLAKLVGALFSAVASDIELRGNIIFYNGQEFSVDPACMGIHMLSISLLLGISLLGMLQRKTVKALRWPMILFYLACLFLLNLVGNVLRILLLVQFAIPPEKVMHEVVGLACLLLYVCVPASFLAKSLVTRAKPLSTTQLPLPTPAKSGAWWLLLLLLVIGYQVTSVDTFKRFGDKYTQTIPGYQSSVSAPGILKLANEQALIYVKFIRGFYDTEHNPSMCWKGSGYEFKEISKRSIHGREVFTASLQKGSEKLYTAWWYGDDKDVITSQTTWRWQMLKGRKEYAVINITASTEETLSAEIKRLVDDHLLQPLFQKTNQSAHEN